MRTARFNASNHRGVRSAAGIIGPACVFLAVVGETRAGFTGTVTVDPFTSAVNLTRGSGRSTSFESGITGGLFDWARYELIHDDLDPMDSGYSSLSMQTDPEGGRLLMQSWRPESSLHVVNHHVLTYRNADGSALDLTGLRTLSCVMTVNGGLHGAGFAVSVMSATKGSATAWQSSDYGDYPRSFLASDFEWASAAGWGDIVSMSLSWTWYGVSPDGVNREISNLNADFVPAPSAAALLALSCAVGLRRRR